LTGKLEKLPSIENRGQTDRVTALTLTYDLDFQSQKNYNNYDPHTKRSSSKVSRFKRQCGNKRTDRRTDGRYRLLYLPG